MQKFLARKEKILPDTALAMIRQAELLAVARGKKIAEFTPSAKTEDLLKAVIGPSGNLRAPTLKIGRQLLVGYNPELYERHFDGHS